MPTPMPDFVAVGIDSSDSHHDIYAEGAGAELRFRITNDLSGFQRLLPTLRDAFGELPCRFALENPALLIARFLLQAGQPVYAVNPRSVARMREALASSGKKDDPVDAESLSVLMRRREDLAPVREGSPEAALLAGLVRQRVDVVQEKNRVSNQLTAVLKGYYPRALELFPKLEQPLTLAFLKAFGSPGALAGVSSEEWAELFAGQRYPRPERIGELLQKAQAPQVPVSPGDEALGSRQVRFLVRQLEVLLDELRSLDKEIQERFDQLPDAKVFRSLPGAADVLAPALFALLGDDRERWGEWHEVARISGTVPVTRTSGKVRLVGKRYHCDRRALRTLHLFAGCSRARCPWAQEFYARQRQLGKSHGTALRNLATKWLRILFRLWKDGTTYDEATYLRRRMMREAPRESAVASPV